jgi:hypothetical protein
MNEDTPFAALSFLMPAPEPRLEELPNLESFEHWVRMAKPGAQITYARGVFLSEERQAVAKVAFRAYEEGKVELCQRRNGNGFDYLAQKRKDLVRPFQAPAMRGDVRKGMGA